MIYNYGSIWFYSVKGNRQYENAGNEKILHHFATDSIPAFLFIVQGTVSSASYVLYDINDTEIDTGSCTVANATNAQGTAYSRISLTGETTSGESDGLYYIKVTYTIGVTDTDVYSDVFCWRTDLSSYLKVVAQTTAMKIGAFVTSAFTYTVYLESANFKEINEINEEGDEKTFGIVSSYVSRNRSHSHEISGYDKTLNFLTGLRVISVNGTVTVTWKQEVLDVYDIVAEEKESIKNKQYVIDLKFRIKDYLQTYDEG